MKTNSIDTPDGTIFYRKNVVDSHTALMCIHGAGSDSKIFMPLLAELKKDFPAIVPDLPGHGRSHHTGIPSLKDYIDAIVSILSFENVTSFIPVGFSMGGALAFELYRKFPEKIPAMIFISSTATLPVSDVVFDLIKSDFASFCDFLVKFLYSRNANDTLKKLSREELAKIGPAIIENDFRICSSIDYRNDLSSIKIPVLIIANRKDKMLPFNLFEESARELSTSKLIVFEDEGHMPMVENPQSTAIEIIKFLSNKI